MEYLKPHLSLSQQVALLQQRGLVADASLLTLRLNDVEYYQFCAYQPAFRISPQNELLITMLLGHHGLHMRSKPISCYLVHTSSPTAQWYTLAQQFLQESQQQGILLHKMGLTDHWEQHPIWR